MPSILERAIRFSTPWFDVVEKVVIGLPDGKRQSYYAVQPSDYVSVLALTASRDIVLVRQYRPVVEAYTLELPAGHVEVGQAPEEAARQELLEETGYLAQQMELLGTLEPDVGRLSNRAWCFFAPDVVPTGNTAVERDTIESVIMSEAELSDCVRQGTFSHAQHLAVLSLAAARGKYFSSPRQSCGGTTAIGESPPT